VDTLTPKQDKFNNEDYDGPAERLRLHLKDETYRLAVSEIVKLTPKAVRYLQSIQEFDWMHDEEAVLLCSKRFVHIARQIAQNCKILEANGGEK
jgi:hypothetical protein